MFVNRVGGRGAVAVVIGALVIAISGFGAAVASSGGVVILGVHNSATSVTTLSNSKGSALALKSKHGTAPLTVNSGKVVKHLNAAKVGGSTASQLKTSGSGAATTYRLLVSATVGFQPTAVAATGKLRAGTYDVTATATVTLFEPNEAARCTLLTTKPASAAKQTFQSSTPTDGTATDTRPMTVRAGQKITEYCWAAGTVTGNLAAAGITAIRVDAATKGTVIVGHPEA
jgi:hypothetical protein